MNKQTLEKLAKNPHYKLSNAQKDELSRVERPPMAAFGEFERNNTDFERHPTEPKKVTKSFKKQGQK